VSRLILTVSSVEDYSWLDLYVLIGKWFDGYVMFKRDWTTFPNFINYSTFNHEHTWEDLCLHDLRNQTYMRFGLSSLNHVRHDFETSVCGCFDIGLVMQHNIEDINPNQ
jgi:hypothetical protein